MRLIIAHFFFDAYTYDGCHTHHLIRRPDSGRPAHGSSEHDRVPFQRFTTTDVTSPFVMY